jgi:hypothetical protein
MKIFTKLILGVILWCVIAPPVWAIRDIREAVAKIYAVYNRYDDEPWKRVISHLNGGKISCMKDLVRAFEEHEEKCHTIVDEHGYIIVLDKNKLTSTVRES